MYKFPVCRPCHASTHSRVLSLPLPPPPDVSLRDSSPCVLLRDGCCKPLSSERFQLSHFFRVHGAGFSPLHQIFIEGETGEAGSPRALLSSTHLTSIPLFRCPLNLSSSSCREWNITNILLWYSCLNVSTIHHFESLFISTIVFLWYLYRSVQITYWQ